MPTVKAQSIYRRFICVLFLICLFLLFLHNTCFVIVTKRINKIFNQVWRLIVYYTENPAILSLSQYRYSTVCDSK